MPRPAVAPVPSVLGRLILDHNPFFLLSALLVLLAGVLLAPARTGVTSTGHLLGIFAFLELYGLALVGTAALVERRAGPGDGEAPREPAARRDAVTLLALAVLFLGDPTFALDALAGSGWIGGMLGLGGAAVGLGILHLAARAARLRWPRTFLLQAGTALLLVHGAPALLARVHAGGGPVGGWHAALALTTVLLPLLLVPAIREGSRGTGPVPLGPRSLVGVVGGVLGTAALGHVVSAGWAHGITPGPWQAAPILLGVGVAIPGVLRRAGRPAAGLLPASGAILAALGLGLTAPGDPLLHVGTAPVTFHRAMLLLAIPAWTAVAWMVDRSELLAVAAGLAVALVAGPRPADLPSIVVDPGLPVTGATVLFALLVTLGPGGHLAGALAGPLALLSALGGTSGLSGVPGGGLELDAWLLAGCALLVHQLVLVHRHRGPGTTPGRTILAVLALGCGLLGATIRGPSTVDLAVGALCLLGPVAGRVGGAPVYGPLGMVGAVGLLGARVGTRVPTDRRGLGILAAVAGVLSLVAGLAVAMLRSRLHGRDARGG